MTEIDRATKTALVASIEEAQKKAEAADAKIAAYLLDVARQEAQEIRYFGSGTLTETPAQAGIKGALDPTEKALETFAGDHGLSRKDAIRRLVVDALIAHGYLAHFELDEDGEVGEALD